MSEWYSGDIIANGVRLHYYHTGGDKPPLVLCHGYTGNALTWSRVARGLEAKYDILMYDARGHGRSEGPDGGYDYDTLSADLVGLIRALGLQRPRLWGHSMGAATVARTAAENSCVAACAILEDPPWYDDRTMAARDWEVGYRNFVEMCVKWRGMTHEALIARERQGNPKWHEDELGPWADSKLELSPFASPKQIVPARPWREWVRQITCPLLLLTAERGMVTPEVADEVASLWRDGRVATIADAGHYIHCDNYASVMAEVQAFLRPVDARERGQNG